MLKCDKNRIVHTRTRRQSVEIKRSVAEQPHLSKPSSSSSSSSFAIHNERTAHIEQDTIIPKIFFETSCKHIHRYCAETGRKFMGFQGPRGPPGPKGVIGPPGKKGRQGKIGRTGLIGSTGGEGQQGISGRCNCLTPDFYLQQATVSGPPITQVTKLVPLKPITIPSGPIIDRLPPMGKTDLSKLTTVVKTTPRILKKPTVVSESTSSSLTLPGDYIATRRDFIADSTTIKPYDGLPTFGYNRRVCLLDAIGIPVLHAESQYSSVGSWMRDGLPYNEEMAKRRWVTDDYASPILYRLFGIRHSSSMLVKYDLESTNQIQMDLGDISYRDCSRRQDHTFENCNEMERDVWLYDRPHNYVDYSADENGLWAIYVRFGMQHITVSKIEPDLHVVQTWDIYELNATGIAETFIMCGILYGLKSGTDRDTMIDFAYDLFSNKTIDVNVKWYNPYGGMTMLHYNPIDGRLYFFDSKRLLSVNVRVEGQIDQFEFSDFD
ncbi:Olfactomedin-like domain protein [Onchocerca flexuosa]|uniref:Olfactomedin-like domain protein n=1 Tax=Onchocerca flexuosa TaxID=387005 RepID=A0A238C5E2_9BILA|nr:Olfactomedin-like domain protein [Onchocerca flexuosa]